MDPNINVRLAMICRPARRAANTECIALPVETVNASYAAVRANRAAQIQAAYAIDSPGYSLVVIRSAQWDPIPPIIAAVPMEAQILHTVPPVAVRVNPAA